MAVILEQVQFLNNSAIHGGGLDINATLPNPVIIVASHFTYNSARVVTEAAGNASVRATLAGNGGAIRCLGGESCLLQLHGWTVQPLTCRTEPDGHRFKACHIQKTFVQNKSPTKLNTQRIQSKAYMDALVPEHLLTCNLLLIIFAALLYSAVQSQLMTV